MIDLWVNLGLEVGVPLPLALGFAAGVVIADALGKRFVDCSCWVFWTPGWTAAGYLYH